MIPLVAAAARYIGVSWVANNVIGNPADAATNYFNPTIASAQPTGGGNTIAEYAAGFYGFSVQTLAPSDMDMRALDDYFESFGYNVQQFRTVNLKVRDTFTYIKTRDAQVTAANLETANQLAAMLNSGCKFWVNEIGE